MRFDQGHPLVAVLLDYAIWVGFWFQYHAMEDPSWREGRRKQEHIQHEDDTDEGACRRLWDGGDASK